MGGVESGEMTYINAKVDRNQPEIVKQLRFLGFDVDPVHRLKKLYDLVVTGVPRWGDRPVAVRVEVKDDKAKLSPAEMEYWQEQRHGHNLIIARNADDVLRWFGWVE